MGRLHWLRHTSSDREWVGASRGGAVHILAIQVLSVEGNWHLLVVVSGWNALFKLIISAFLSATPHSRLNNELVVTLFHWHVLAVLGRHNFLTNSVDGEVLLDELTSLPGIKTALLGRSEVLVVFLFELLPANFLVLLLHELVHAANAWDIVRWVLVLAPSLRSWSEFISDQLAVDPGVSVVEDLICNDWVFKIVVTLGNVFPRNRPADALEFLHGALLLPVGNECTVLLVVGVFVKGGVHFVQLVSSIC